MRKLLRVFVYVATLYLPFVNANAVIPLVPITNQQLAMAASASQASIEEIVFARLVLEEARNENTGVVSAEAVKRAITKFVLLPTLSIDQTATLIAKQLAQDSTSLADSLSVSSGLVTQLLLPYMYQAGMCTGDLWSSDGLICSYLSSATPMTVSGTLADVSSGSSWTIGKVAPSSSLGQILTKAVEKCTAQTKTTTSSSAANGSPTINCFALRSMEGRVVVARLSEAEYAAYYLLLVTKYDAYQAAKAADSDTDIEDYFGNYLLEALAGVFVNLEVYGEAYFAANVDYLVDDSDSALAIYPFGYKCRLSRCQAFGECAARRGADALACGDQYGERRYWDIRPNGSYLQHSFAACNAAPIAAASRPTFQAVQQGIYPLPYGLKFQTSHQQAASTGGVPAATNVHLFPPPSSYTGPVIPYPQTALTSGIPTWRYNFLKVRTWDYNLVFAGLKSAKTGTGNCQRTRFFGSGSATGDAFWMWYGQGQGEVHNCNSSPYELDQSCPGYIGEGGSNPMPTVALIWGQNLSHAPVACTVENAPCSGLNCLPPVEPPPVEPPPIEPPCDGLDCLPPVNPPPIPPIPPIPPVPRPPEYCGNGQCAAWEGASCPEDCGPIIGICGDGQCSGDGFDNPMTCPSDCGAGS